MDVDAIKGQAISAISAFNTRQTGTVEMIDIAPWNMRVLDQDTVIQDTARERVMISRRIGSMFEVVGRQRKP
jgi:hypothetical protein